MLSAILWANIKNSGDSKDHLSLLVKIWGVFVEKDTLNVNFDG